MRAYAVFELNMLPIAHVYLTKWWWHEWKMTLNKLYILDYLATPFWRITLPLCRCPWAGKPRSRKNNNASKICRPNRATCDNGKHVDFFVYFRFHGSFHCDCEKAFKRCVLIKQISSQKINYFGKFTLYIKSLRLPRALNGITRHA